MTVPFSPRPMNNAGRGIWAMPLAALAFSAILFAPGAGVLDAQPSAAASCGKACALKKAEARARARTETTINGGVVFAPMAGSRVYIKASPVRTLGVPVRLAPLTAAAGKKTKPASSRGRILVRGGCGGFIPSPRSSSYDDCMTYGAALDTRTAGGPGSPGGPGTPGTPTGIPGSHVALSGSIALSGTITAGGHTVSVNNGVSVNQSVGVAATTAPGTSSGFGFGNGMSSASSVGTGTAGGFGQGYGNSLSETASSMADAVSGAAQGSIGGGVGIGAGMGASGSVD